MIIFNTTFHVDISEAKNLVIYLHEVYIPQATESGILQNGRLCRIISSQSENAESFSVQFETENTSTLHKWYGECGRTLSDNINKAFKGKVQGFSTIMEIID
jgi:hypothetical protein